jgi:perosamine synthetase
MIPYWKKKFYVNNLYSPFKTAILNKNISQGKLTEVLEKKISQYLKVRFVMMCSNGSSAMLIALMALNLKKGDEIIVPDRGWISIAHAAHILGIKLNIVDVKKNIPIINEDLIEKAITKKTKAIIPIHMGGRSCDMRKINYIAKKNKLHLIEDAAQAFGVKNNKKFLGTCSLMGCFSLSTAKTFSTGQGGFIVTNNKLIYKKIKMMRTHGLKDTIQIKKWTMPGFNFRYTDLQASVGLNQYNYINVNISKMKIIYYLYKDHLIENNIFKLIPVNIKNGEIPQYIEALCTKREDLIKFLIKNNIDCRRFYPSISEAKYLALSNKNSFFFNSNIFSKNGLYLPSGPDQKLQDLHKVIKLINFYLK